MTLQTPTRSDFYDHPADRQSAFDLAAMVITTQVIGLLLISFAVAILQEPKWPIGKYHMALSVFGVGLLFLAVWGFYCWKDQLRRLSHYRNPSARTKHVPTARRKTYLLQATFALILADTLFLSTLIVITGGLGESPLDPLLPAIPVLAIILRQPYRTVMCALMLGLMLVAMFIVVQFNAVHVAALTCVHGVFPQIDSWIYPAHSDPHYKFALGLVAVGVVGLSIGEYWYSTGTPEILRDIPETFAAIVGDEYPELNGIEKEVKAGATYWIEWLSHRGLPLKDLSVVHDERDVIRQAIVLCVPSWLDDLPETRSGWLAKTLLKRVGETILPPNFIRVRGRYIRRRIRDWRVRRRRRKIARSVTFLTLAAHWIDDHFDALEANCADDKTRDSILRQSPKTLLNGQLPRLNEVVHGMKKSVFKENRREIERAVQRIIYGGLFQHAQTEDRRNQLTNEYLVFITSRLYPEQAKVYSDLAASDRPLTLFLTAKVVMELLDSCMPSEPPPIALIRRSEYFNLLYSPILYRHDWEKELSHEKYGGAFENVNDYLPTPEELVNLVTKCSDLTTLVFGRSTLSTGRKTQLALLLKMYDEQLFDDLKAAYKTFL